MRTEQPYDLKVETMLDANQVALEAEKSPANIFRHYRELVTEEAAWEWFGIVPPDGWVPPEEKRQRRRRNMGDARYS